MPIETPSRPYLQIQRDEIRLFIKVQPRSKRLGFQSIHADRIKIGISAPPVDGKANDELIRYLSKALGCPKRAIRIARGETSTEKEVLVERRFAERIDEWLGTL